jgi:hypothetical protein
VSYSLTSKSQSTLRELTASDIEYVSGGTVAGQVLGGLTGYVVGAYAGGILGALVGGTVGLIAAGPAGVLLVAQLEPSWAQNTVASWAV